MNKIWSLTDLPELKVADCLAFRAEGWQRPAMKLIGAESFHWALAGVKIDYRQIFNVIIQHRDDFPAQLISRLNERLAEIEVGDYQVVDSISKGITHHLLSEYQTRHMRVYRPKYQDGVQDALAPFFLERYLYYGDQTYDKKGVLMVAAWLLLNKAGFNVEWWEHDANQFWCLEFDEIVHRDYGLALVSENEPAYPTNMERSPMLELIWSTF